MQTILVTGGLGYIGSHTVVELVNKGHQIIIIDNCSNSSETVVERLKEIVKTKSDNIIFHKEDLMNKFFVENVFTPFHISNADFIC